MKTMVLLENKQWMPRSAGGTYAQEKTLPLKKGCRIAVIGPYADNQDALGMWAIHGNKENVV